MLQGALSSGVAAEGVEVVDLGVLPTPGVAALAVRDAAAAAIVSASHNPYQDNGIKLLGPGGRKLSVEQEAEVEAELEREVDAAGQAARDGVSSVASIHRDPGALEWYCERVVSVIEGRRLRGTRVVLDCANGAAYTSAPAIMERAGVDVVEVLSASPDGTNINLSCGSTDPSALGAAVVRTGAHAGLAFDGDADRVIAVDERGQVVDGDRLLALFAVDLRDRDLLAGSTVVVTVMTNLGFHLAMRAAGIRVEQTPVGDRNVLEALDGGGYALGGEQSGHLVFRRLATTGDGAMTGLLLLDLLARTGGVLSERAAASMVRLPQVLRNVPVADPSALEGCTAVWDQVRAVERELGSNGRVLLRPSGTERLIRVMVEAPTEAKAEASTERLAGAVAAALS
jgi:phosphoglucosamine mutase